MSRTTCADSVAMMIAHNRGRLFLAIVLVFAVTVLLCLGAVAQERPMLADWHSQLDDAKQDAVSANRLLIVVDLDSDFARRKKNAREACLYDRLILQDHSVRQFIAQRGVGVVRRVGPSGNVKPFKRQRTHTTTLSSLDLGSDQTAQATGNVVTYFCTPKGDVLNLIVGYLSPSQWLEQATWSWQLYQELQELDGSSHLLRAALVRRAHQQRRLVDDEEFFAKLIDDPNTLHDGQRLQRTDDLVKLVEAVRYVRIRRWAERMGTGISREAFAEMSRSIAFHGDVEPTANHLLLSVGGLLDLKSLQLPVGKILAEIDFSQRSPRSRQLAQQVESAIADGRPVLLVIQGNDGFPARHQEKWWKEGTSHQQRLSQFEVVSLNHLELAGLITDAGLEPVQYRDRGPLRFVVLDEYGEFVGTVSQAQSVSTLSILIEKACRTHGQ